MYIQREGLLIINDLSIPYDDYEFSWTYKSEDDDSPDFFEVEIANLNENTRNQISKGDKVIFNFGFNGDSGNLIQGYVDKKEISYSDSITNKLKLKVIEVEGDAWKVVSKSYESKTASYIINDIANEIGFQVREMDLKNDISYSTGYVAQGKGINLIKTLVEACESKLKVEGDYIYIYDEDKEDKSNAVEIKFGSGLLELPQEIKEKEKNYDYKIKALAFHQLRKNSIVRVEAKNLKSYGKILKLEINNWVGNYYIKVLGV